MVLHQGLGYAYYLEDQDGQSVPTTVSAAVAIEQISGSSKDSHCGVALISTELGRYKLFGTPIKLNRNNLFGALQSDLTRAWRAMSLVDIFLRRVPRDGGFDLLRHAWMSAGTIGNAELLKFPAMMAERYVFKTEFEDHRTRILSEDPDQIIINSMMDALLYKSA